MGTSAIPCCSATSHKKGGGRCVHLPPLPLLRHQLDQLERRQETLPGLRRGAEQSEVEVDSDPDRFEHFETCAGWWGRETCSDTSPDSFPAFHLCTRITRL